MKPFRGVRQPSDGWSDEWSVGREIRILADGGGVPLWDEGGHLPEEAEFLCDFLGLSSELVRDLEAWSNDAEKLRPDMTPEAWDEAGRHLQTRLQDELGTEFRVSLQL